MPPDPGSREPTLPYRRDGGRGVRIQPELRSSRIAHFFPQRGLRRPRRFVPGEAGSQRRPAVSGTARNSLPSPGDVLRSPGRPKRDPWDAIRPRPGCGRRRRRPSVFALSSWWVPHFAQLAEWPPPQAARSADPLVVHGARLFHPFGRTPREGASERVRGLSGLTSPYVGLARPFIRTTPPGVRALVKARKKTRSNGHKPRSMPPNRGACRYAMPGDRWPHHDWSLWGNPLVPSAYGQRLELEVRGRLDAEEREHGRGEMHDTYAVRRQVHLSVREEDAGHDLR